jgi:hypothetical protein
MARSIAIIMMLEGHMTGAALADEFRNDAYPIYSWWRFIHGITSPLFFTVSGVIFSYLLVSNNHLPFWENNRVKKGFRRVVQLLFWGYFLQLNLLTVFKVVYTDIEYNTEWLNSFHVLQSIATGIFMLLLLYGLYKLLRIVPLYLIYILGGIILFTLNGYLENYIFVQKNLVAGGFIDHPQYFPHGAPAFIQNIIYGQYSEFSIVRYGGYTLFGGAIGALIKRYEYRIISISASLAFIGAGLLAIQFMYPILDWIDGLLYEQRVELLRVQIFNEPAMAGMGIILTALGVMILLNRFFTIPQNLFLKMGQNTLPIYIIHVIILYEGIFGLGLYPTIINHNLNPYQAIGASASFIALFFLMVKYIEPLEELYRTFIRYLFLRKKED